MRIRALLVSVSLVAGTALVVAPAAHAATEYTWTGAGDHHSWSLATNWSPNGVPGTGAGAGTDTAHLVPCNATVDNVPSGVELFNFNFGPATTGCTATIADSHEITVSGFLTWNGGEIDDALAIHNGDISPDGTGPTTLGNELTVGGELDLDDNAVSTNGQILLDNSAELLIGHGGTVKANGTNYILDDNGCNDSGIDNQGTLDVHDGSLVFTGLLDQNGTLKTEDPDSEFVLNGNCSFSSSKDGADYTGPGRFVVTGNETFYTLSGTQTLGSGFRFVLGGDPAGTQSAAVGYERLLGTFSFAGSGEFDWDGGILAAAATLGNGIVTVVDGTPPPSGDPADDHQLFGDSIAAQSTPTPITNHGLLSFVHSPHVGAFDNPRLYNKSDAVTVLDAGATIAGSGAFGNSGHLIVAPGGTDDGTTATFDDFGLVNSGRVDVSMNDDDTFHVPSLTNSGTVMLSRGTLDDEGDYRQTAGKTTLTEYAVLDVTAKGRAVRLSAGEVTGDGRINGSVVNTGAIISPSYVRPVSFAVVHRPAAAPGIIPDAVARLSIYGGYTGGSKSKLYTDVYSATVYDVLGVHGNVALRGTLVGRNLHTPSSSWKPTPVIATGTLSASLSCVATSGLGSTGSAARHWTPSLHGNYLFLYSIAGRRTSC